MMRSTLAAAMMLGGTAASAQTIAVNQHGFEPDAPKRAIVASDAPQPLAWTLVDAAGREQLSGRTIPIGPDKASGQALHLIDFGALSGPGEGYRLRVGEAQSVPFKIVEDIHRGLADDALAYFYHNRAGTPIEPRYAGDETWARPAGHPEERVTCFSGEDMHGNRWPGCDYKLDVTGGWYDAGDHGKYVVNGGIALWTLLNLHEMMPRAFPDGSAAIPEAGNDISDLLDHARWQMEFMLAMQVPQSTRLRVPVGQKTNDAPLVFTQIDASGMAQHKVASEQWTALPMRPGRDPFTRALYAPSTSATLNLAATAAQCARIWREADPAFAQRCLDAATRAWSAAQRNPEVYAVGAFHGSGGYGDGTLSDEFYWAAAELYATTGEPRFAEALRASPHFAVIEREPGWPSTAPLGTLTLALVENGLAAKEIARLRAAVTDAADRWAEERAQVGYRIPYASLRYAWGSNSNLLNRALVMGAAHRLTGENRYRGAMIDVIDYLLGRNPLRMSYVSGYGERAMKAPHHRFWAGSIDPDFPPPPPGALSGGPNNTAMSDEVAKAMQGKCAPQTCWADDARSYAMNEVAINWNAPLVWVAAYLAGSE